jgi:hypothetical protein
MPTICAAARYPKPFGSGHPRGSFSVSRLLGATALSLLIAGCDPSDPSPPPAALSCATSPAHPSAPPRSSNSPGAAPAEIIRDTTIYDGPGTDAGRLGDRLAGTQTRVYDVVGERANIFEREDIHLASWIDLADITMAQADWERYRPQRSATAIGMYPPSAGLFPTQAGTTVLRTAAAFLETFLEAAAPGIVLLVHTDYGLSDGHLTIAIPRVPTCPELRDLPPKPAPWDSKRRKEYEQIVQENERRIAEYTRAREQIEREARAQITALLGLQPSRQANAGGALAQIARDLSRVDAPTRRVVMALNPARESPPSDPGIDLRGLRVSLILHCYDGPIACAAAERVWRSRLAVMGALAVRSFDATSPGLALALNPARPEPR